jgi:ATP-binding cassette subfamily C protein CydCD
MRTDPRLLRLARSAGFLLAVTILSGFAAGIFAVGQAQLLSRLINGVFLLGWGVEENGGLAAVMPRLWLLLAVMALRAASLGIMDYSAGAAALRIKSQLRQQVMEHLLALGPRFAGAERSGELAHTSVDGVEALETYFSQYLPQIVLATLIPLAYLMLVFPLDMLTGLVLVLTAPLIPLFMSLIGSQTESLTRRQWQNLSRLSAFFTDILQGLATLKLLGRSGEQVDRLGKISQRYHQTTMQVLRVTFLSALALELIATISTAVVAVEVGLRLLYGRLAFEQAFFLLVLAPEFYQPLRQLGARFHAGMAGVAAAGRIFTILEIPMPKKVEEQAAVRPAPPFTIRFDQVYFTYPGGRETLTGVSFSLPPGRRLVLSGMSGSGKSTVAALLLRFYEPSQGDILVNERSLRDYDLDDWRQQIAWVPQEPYLFHGTALDNLRLAQPRASLERVHWAARQANVHEFILNLPEGYNTVIGERGARISGGEAQRLALARAFLKDAPILILDEPTTHLDLDNERLVLEAIERISADRTVLVISHQESSLHLAADLMYLDQGVLVKPVLSQEIGQIWNRSPAKLEDTEPPIFADGVPGSYSPAQATSLVRSDQYLNQPLVIWPTLDRLISFLRQFASQVLASVLLGFATVASSMGLMSAAAYVLSKAALQPSIADLQAAIVAIRFFGISRGVFRYIERLATHSVTLALIGRFRQWFYQAIEPLAPARLASYHSGELLSRMIADVAVLESFYVRAVAPPLSAILVFIAAIFALAALDVFVALAFAGIYLLSGLLVPLMSHSLSVLPGRQAAASRAALYTAVFDAIQGMPDLLALSCRQTVVHQVDDLSQGLCAAQNKLFILQSIQTGLMSLCSGLGVWLVLLGAIPGVAAARIDGVLLGSLALLTLAAFEAVQPLPLAAQYLDNSLKAASRLFEVIDARPEVAAPVQPLPVPATNGLEVRDVWFSYPESPSPLTGRARRFAPPFLGGRKGLGEEAVPFILRLSFSLPPGKHLGIVGPSGSGKTSLLHLLLRFWEYQAGEITLGGVDVRRLAQGALRSRFAVVAQRTDLFTGTIRDNLLLAHPKASLVQLEQATRAAQLHDFVAGLPQGYDTWIGDRGLQISGGQRQRLAIARAVLLDAPIWLLDEPTAHLDAATTEQLISALGPLLDGRSAIWITHNPGGLQMMDEILVMERGRVIGRGTHDRLLATSPYYSSLINSLA